MKSIVINGSNISIRTFSTDDIAQFYEAAIESVEHMHQFLPWCHPGYAMNECELWVNTRSRAWDCGEEYSFLIVANSDSAIMGGIAINEVNLTHKIGNIGYWVRKSGLNKGMATEAVSLIARFGFKLLGLNRLEIVTLPNNVASNKVARKAGAKYEGIMQKRLVVHGKALDSCIYSLVDKR